MPPNAQLSRFAEGRLELFEAQLDQIEYIAISHVWGETQWLQINGVDREVYVSPRKAAFIRDRLPCLVADTPFWMDTLTVNQKDPDEVLSVVQLIPDIFRCATKTIAIREGDSLFRCCARVIDASTTWKSIHHDLCHHIQEKHGNHLFRESYLRRLWTLQECLLSNTIQFVLVGDEIIQEDENWAEDPEGEFLKPEQTLDSLYVLGCSFSTLICLEIQCRPPWWTGCLIIIDRQGQGWKWSMIHGCNIRNHVRNLGRVSPSFGRTRTRRV